MRTPINRPSFFMLGLAICNSMRHTGTEEITSDLALQMNGPKVEMVPDLVREAEKLETLQSREFVKIYLKRVDPIWYPPTLSTKGQRRDNLMRPINNATPLKHYKNPQRFRRG